MYSFVLCLKYILKLSCCETYCWFSVYSERVFSSQIYVVVCYSLWLYLLASLFCCYDRCVCSLLLRLLLMRTVSFPYISLFVRSINAPIPSRGLSSGICDLRTVAICNLSSCSMIFVAFFGRTVGALVRVPFLLISSCFLMFSSAMWSWLGSELLLFLVFYNVFAASRSSFWRCTNLSFDTKRSVL